MSDLEYMIIWPLISSLLATLFIISACIWARKMYWKDREKKRLIKLGKALDRYISKNRDAFLDENNIPEWYERYKSINLEDRKNG